MGIVDNLLTASRRTSREEALRVAAALNETLDAPLRDPDGSVSATSVVDAAEAAHHRAVVEIAEEKNPRPAPTAEHAAAFVEQNDDEEVPAFRDAEPPGENVRTDPRFLLTENTDPDGEDGEEAQASHPWHIPEPVAVPTGDDDTGADLAHDDGAGNDEEATGPIPVVKLDQPPSATDDYPEHVLSGFSDGDELDLPPQEPSPAPTRTAPPLPSTRATAPPEWFDAPDPDPGPGLAERMRERVAAALESLRGRGGRPKLAVAAAGAALVVVIAVVAVFSLSGGRGKPPEPAGVTAAAPTATDNVPPARSESTLVPATVSASCVGDSDSVAPFAGEKSRAWVCGRANGLDGSVLNITFGKAVVVTQITIVPGFNYVAPDGRDEWSRHRLITGVTWRLGGKTYPQAINPTRTGATIKLPSVVTQEMSMTITASTRPPAPADNADRIGKEGSASAADADATTAVSSIVITGYPVDPGA